MQAIPQPHVRPIIRGKQNKPVEFGAKLGVSLSGDSIFLVMNLLVLLRFLFVRVLTHTGHHVAAVLEAHIHWLHTITIRQTGKLKQSSLLEMAF
jgi:hypothetical protein